MHPQCPHPSWIEIDLKQFKDNLSLIRAFIGNTLFCLAIKANAYGHGLVPIGKVAEEAGVDYLAVAHLQEAVELRHAGVALPILVLGAIHEEQIPDLLNYNLEFTISSKYKADLVAACCQREGKKGRVHLEVDSGMHRTGMRPQTTLDLLTHLQGIDCLELVGVYSHLATADQPGDSFAHKQIQTFRELLGHPLLQQRKILRHLANSGGTLFYPEAYLDMVRPSLMAFGYISGSCPPALASIRPCFSLKSKVSYFKVVEQGAGISYGHTYRTSERTRIVTIPIGYGDGYRRSLSNRGHVLIRGKRYPIVGAICMDQCMVDVGQDTVYVGDEVVLIGRQGSEEIRLEEIAALCQTIPYEVLCFFNDRLPRVYIKSF